MFGKPIKNICEINSMNADDDGLTKCTSIKMSVVFIKLTIQKCKSSNLLNIILNVDQQPTVD